VASTGSTIVNLATIEEPLNEKSKARVAVGVVMVNPVSRGRGEGERVD
jgi:hypothetical protein